MQHPGPAMEIIYHKQPKMLIVFCEQTAKQWVIQSRPFYTQIQYKIKSLLEIYFSIFMKSQSMVEYFSFIFSLI